jgi:undecaprenyl-diphosphatase
MTLLHIIILAIVQGFAELLPISSSAHVIIAEKLMGLHVTSPKMTLLLVMLHTGTMFAVIVYFWKSWKEAYFSSREVFKRMAWRLIAATLVTGVIGVGLFKIIDHTVLRNIPNAHIEDLFGKLNWIAPALFAAGVMIIVAGLMRRREDRNDPTVEQDREVTMRQSLWIGLVQGFAVPFRGFSRSGSTISAGMLTGTTKRQSEVFSFALVIILTPAAIAKEALRALHEQHAQAHAAVAVSNGSIQISGLFLPSMIGMVFSFLAGLLALKWLSGWLENGRWYFFGIYCLFASVVVYTLYLKGF